MPVFRSETDPFTDRAFVRPKAPRHRFINDPNIRLTPQIPRDKRTALLQRNAERFEVLRTYGRMRDQERFTRSSLKLNGRSDRGAERRRHRRKGRIVYSVNRKQAFAQLLEQFQSRFGAFVPG